MSSVSVVIPTYNRARLLGASLESALSQTYEDLEVIVVDDGSADETQQVVQSYVASSGSRVRYVFQENQGISAARNKGCRLARGRYLAFLDSDDLWKPEKLALQVPVIEADPEVGLVASMAEVVDAANARVLGIKPKASPGTTLSELVLRGFAPPSTFLVRREAIASVGYFDPEIRRGLEDLDLCFRLARHWKLVCLQQPLIRYRYHDANLSLDRAGIYVGFIRVYEKLLASSDGNFSRDVARQRLAKYHYLLGKVYAQRHEACAALAEVVGAIRTSPLVGLNFVTDSHQWWERFVIVLKPYLHLCGLSAASLFYGNGHTEKRV